ncbi:hypothetical protein [Natronorarus salvus]|uniref:hypothetical protein n=1 Tax=Natronorarus salvus TaxID=3117733 RepID=UPI002F265C50
MGGLKKGTGSLNFEDEGKTDVQEETRGHEHQTVTEEEAEPQVADAPTGSSAHSDEHGTVQRQEGITESASQAEMSVDDGSYSYSNSPPQGPNFNMNDLPYLVQRRMRGASVNADRTNQLLLEVRPFVKDDEDTFLEDLNDLVDGPVYKGDAREAAMVVAQENPELVAEKLREWGIEYLDK